MGDKRNAIIKAAIELLVKENYQTMKTASLASLAGVAEGTLYRYFKNKKEIYTTVLTYLGDEMIENFFVGISKENSLKKNIEIQGINFAKVEKENRQKVIVYAKAFSEIDDEEIKEILKTVMDNGINKVKEMFYWAIETKEIEFDEKELNILAAVFWGVAEFYIKRSMAGFVIKENEIINGTNFLYKLINFEKSTKI